MADPGPSRNAIALYRCIRRHGGALRIATLLKRLPSGDDQAALGAAIDELMERYWIRILWRNTMPPTPPGEPRPLDHIAHLTATRFSRHKHRGTWGMR